MSSGIIGVLGTVAFTVYGQMIIKWRIENLRDSGTTIQLSVRSMISTLFDPWIFSGFLSAGVAAVFWIVALNRLPLSIAYPFMSLSFVAVLLLSVPLLGEHVGVAQIIGIVFVLAGLCIGASA